jgi:hypothetical protein
MGIALAAVLPACIVLPTAVPQQAPFQEDSLQFIEIGLSTKEQIREGLPVHETRQRVSLVAGPYELPGGRWFYTATREMWGWGGCVLGNYLFPECAGGRGQREYFLVVDFSEDSTVSAYGVLDEESFARNLASLVLPGQTTKSDVLLTFGEPHEITGDSVWRFTAGPPVLDEFCGQNFDGFASCEGGNRQRDLRITFDAEGLATDVQVEHVAAVE